MTHYKREILLGFFIIFVTAQIIYTGDLLYFGTPDIQYVMAKVLWVLEGEIYTDPITGFTNFHPPFYHLILSLFVRLGVSIDHILLIISVFNIGATCMAMLFIIRRCIDKDAAIITALLFPFIINYMGHGNPFLATAFPFSLPIYLLGLWMYLSPVPSWKTDLFTSICWGAAFLISPVYLFLIGCTFAYDLVWRRDLPRFGIMAGVFLIVIVPFFIQAYEVYQAGMAGTSTFSFWRGIPDWGVIKNAVMFFLSPVENSVFSWQVLVSMVVFILGIVGVFKTRPLFSFTIIAFAAYVLTSYHFSPQYAIRIHFILSFIVVGYAVKYLMSFRHYRRIIVSILLALAVYGVGDHFYRTDRLLGLRAQNYPFLMESGAGLWEKSDELFGKGEWILASNITYRYYVMSHFTVHALAAYRTGQYFQINQMTSELMERDYQAVMESSNIHLINHICEKYSISKCLIRKIVEDDIAAFTVIARKWQPVYEDDYFVLYEKI